MNWHDIQQLRSLEKRLENIGFRMLPSKWSNGMEARIGVFPTGDANPILSRDAEIFSGTTSEIMCWVAGVEHRNMYLAILKATNEIKIKNLEQKYVKKRAHKAAVRLIKDPNLKLSEDDKEYMKMASK